MRPRSRGPPTASRTRFRAAAEWANDALGDERVGWLRRLPSERRLVLDDTMVLACHASPGSQTQGFDAQLDPSVVLERVSRTDARLICCGHTHVPEVRDLGWKLIVNDGSAGYVFDGDPTASWALSRSTGRGPGRDPPGRVRHDDRRQRDLGPGPARRRLPGGDRPHRAARPMTANGNGEWPAAPRRVVVTGMGMLTALGNDVPTTWAGDGRGTIRASARSSRSIRRGSSPGSPARSRTSTRRHVLDRRTCGGPTATSSSASSRRARRWTRPACRPGWRASEAERTGVILGTGLGGVGTLVDGITINALRGPDRISPFFIPMGIPNVGAGQIAISFGMTGPNFTTVSACATGGHAIGEAWETIRRGDADTMVAGGSEAGIYEPLVGGFDSMRALSRRNDDPAGASRPFDQGRDGFVIGRRLRRARPRGAGARPGARRADPRRDHRLRRDGRRLAHHAARARRDRRGAGPARRALRKAGLEPSDIDHVNAHATSTPEGDKAELAGDPDDLRRARRRRHDHGQQVDDRPHPRRRRRDRGDRHDPDDARAAASRRRSTSTTSTRQAEGLDLTPNVARRHDVRDRARRTRSGSAARTRP